MKTLLLITLLFAFGCSKNDSDMILYRDCVIFTNWSESVYYEGITDIEYIGNELYFVYANERFGIEGKKNIDQFEKKYIYFIGQK